MLLVERRQIVLTGLFVALGLSAAADVKFKELGKMSEPVVSAFASSNHSVQTLRISQGQVVHLEYVPAKRAGAATFLFLPGVNRSLLVKDPMIATLISQGFGVALFNHSVQPLSIALLVRNERPAFLTQEMNLRTLAEETQAVARHLTASGAKQLIPVSLSYTGSESSLLGGFSLIIDAVPMTSSAATNIELENYRRMLKSAEIWNPIFGPGITRASLDLVYRKRWIEQTAKMIDQFHLPPERSADMVEGYMQMSRAVEGFEWTPQVWRAQGSPRRMLVLAGNEAPDLLNHQLKTFQQMLKDRSDALMFLVLESGHVVPTEQPAVFSAILRTVAEGLEKLQAGVVIVEPSKNKSRVLAKDQALQVLEKMILETENSK